MKGKYWKIISELVKDGSSVIIGDRRCKVISYIRYEYPWEHNNLGVHSFYCFRDTGKTVLLSF